MNHIELVQRAIEFKKPDILPLELVDVPEIYNAYGTLDSEKVKFIPGTENFDSAWATYHWTFQDCGRNEKGEILRKDEWGCLQKIPEEENSAYAILENPLRSKNSLEGYEFPNPEITRPFFENINKVIKENYPDRFICGYLDPAAFLIAFNILGYDYLLIKLADDIKFVVELIGQIFAYQHQLIPQWKKAGAHMVNLIDEVAGTSGMMFNPLLWKKYFKNFYAKLFKHIHQEGMYTGILLDGDIEAILDDLLAMEIDVLQFMQPNTIGIDTLENRIKGKKCLKCSVDMMTTLAQGKPEEVKKEAKELVEKFNSSQGGFICNVLRWYRPEYPEDNVLAQVEAFNQYRR